MSEFVLIERLSQNADFEKFLFAPLLGIKGE
jgi:hypothetical protein